jgi:hypothetical protein
VSWVLAQVSTSLLSVSVLELTRFGRIKFSLLESVTLAYIAEITVNDFQITRGANVFTNAHALAQIDPSAAMGSEAYNASERAIRRFFASYAAGNTTHAVLRGPVDW